MSDGWTVHDDDPRGDDDPGEWATAPRLYDAEIASIVLCRYVARPLVDGQCPARNGRRHPDVDCATLYHSEAALTTGALEALEDGPITTETVVRSAAGDPTVALDA